MKQIRLYSFLLMFAFGITAITSCTSEPKKPAKETVINTDVPETVPKQDTMKVAISGNDQMQYDISEIDVLEGQTVVLTLTHTGKMPVDAMGHNFVLLAKGTTVSVFAEEALKAKATDYIPEDQSNVIAHTKLGGGGESTTITFQAPEKGTYDFICSFPGHYSMMKGKFNVE